MIALGVDPGLQGGIVMIDTSNNRVVAKATMPTKASHRDGYYEVDGTALSRIMAEWINDLGKPGIAHVEQVGGRPGQMGQFQFGVNTGKVLGVLEAYDIPVNHIPAHVWKGAYHLHRGPEESTHSWKKRSIEQAERIFKNVGFYNQDGVAEAALIAFYGEHSK